MSFVSQDEENRNCEKEKNGDYLVVSKIILTFARKRTLMRHVMAYAKIDIVIKNPSARLEERIREAGRQKYERMQKTLQDWKEGKYKGASVLMVK